MALGNKILFHWRLFIYFTVLFCVFLLCFFLFQYNREKKFKEEKLNSELQILDAQIGDLVSDSAAIYSLISNKKSNKFPDLRVTILDTLGTVVFDTKENNSKFLNHINRPEIQQALKRGTGYTSRRHSESTDTEYFYSARKIDGYIVRSALPYSVSLKESLQTDNLFIWFMFIIVIAIFVLIYAFSHRMGLAMQRLRNFAMHADKGEIINEKFPNDELGEISQHIVQLYSNLQKAKTDVLEEQKEIQFQQAEKERIKKQLTQNINHELKTPVSSIHGYLETIINNPGISKEQILIFAQKSYDQTNRLAALLKDVSTITRLDEASDVIEKTNVNITEIISEIINDIALLPIENRMRINTNIDKPLIVRGNQSLIHSIFRNLTDNALVHSGGRDIFINIIDESETDYKFSFSDNGIGVEPEHLQRIFERFYRVDKGRSRKMGGTGLGLSIVKNAIIFHGGTIVAKASESGGLEFIFNIKK